jgi:hypothetical protein
VIGVGGMSHPEKKTDRDDGEQCEHLQNFLGYAADSSAATHSILRAVHTTECS